VNNLPDVAPVFTSSDPWDTIAVKAGAYRPPHARGTATPPMFKREDEGGSPSVALNTPSRPTNGTANGFPQRRRVVPGAAPPAQAAGGNGAAEKDKPSRRKKKEANKEKKEVEVTAEATKAPSAQKEPETPAKSLAAVEEASATAHTHAGLTPEDKKRRALVKKLTAIETLKDKSGLKYLSRLIAHD
jgi:translation initiation factor 2A